MEPLSRERLRAAAQKVFRGTGTLVAYAYGSRVSGKPRPDSDLDVGYYLLPQSATLPLGQEMRLAADLSTELGVDVDLRCLGDAPLELRGRILEEGVRIYSSDDSLRVGLESATLSFYHDYKSVFARMHELRLGRGQPSEIEPW